jgi:hypothetical protein
MFRLLANPWVLLGLILSLAASHGVAYYKGYQSRDNKAKIELLKETQAKIEAMEAYDLISRQFVKGLQEKQAETKVIYRTITKEIPNATTGRVCFNDNAVSLWDDALKGRLPEATARAAEKTSGASDTQVLENAIINFEQYESCRTQLNALIDWHERVQ